MSRKDKDWKQKIRTLRQLLEERLNTGLGSNWIIALGLYVGLLASLSAFTNVSANDQATITNTLSATSGVLLALYFLVPKTSQSDVIGLLLASILLSLSSSIFSLGTPPGINSKVLFVLSVSLFASSTLAFAMLVRSSQGSPPATS